MHLFTWIFTLITLASALGADSDPAGANPETAVKSESIPTTKAELEARYGIELGLPLATNDTDVPIEALFGLKLGRPLPSTCYPERDAKSDVKGRRPSYRITPPYPNPQLDRYFVCFDATGKKPSFIQGDATMANQAADEKFAEVAGIMCKKYGERTARGNNDFAYYVWRHGGQCLTLIKARHPNQDDATCLILSISDARKCLTDPPPTGSSSEGVDKDYWRATVLDEVTNSVQRAKQGAASALCPYDKLQSLLGSSFDFKGGGIPGPWQVSAASGDITIQAGGIGNNVATVSIKVRASASSDQMEKMERQKQFMLWSIYLEGLIYGTDDNSSGSVGIYDWVQDLARQGINRAIGPSRATSRLVKSTKQRFSYVISGETLTYTVSISRP